MAPATRHLFSSSAIANSLLLVVMMLMSLPALAHVHRPRTHTITILKTVTVSALQTHSISRSKGLTHTAQMGFTLTASLQPKQVVAPSKAPAGKHLSRSGTKTVTMLRTATITETALQTHSISRSKGLTHTAQMGFTLTASLQPQTVEGASSTAERSDAHHDHAASALNRTVIGNMTGLHLTFILVAVAICAIVALLVVRHMKKRASPRKQAAQAVSDAPFIVTTATPFQPEVYTCENHDANAYCDGLSNHHDDDRNCSDATAIVGIPMTTLLHDSNIARPCHVDIDGEDATGDVRKSPV